MTIEVRVFVDVNFVKLSVVLSRFQFITIIWVKKIFF